MTGIDRRAVLGGMAGAGALAFSARSYARILGANDRIHMGIIGANSRGAVLAQAFARSRLCSVDFVCDVDSRVLERVTGELTKAGHAAPKTHKDLRKALEDTSIDAVAVATPDHWHAPAAIMALTARKHVYVEKPCSHNPQEGEWLVEAQAKYDRVVQIGTQQRSSLESREAADLVHGGIIGEPYEAYIWYANARKSIGSGKKVPAPDYLDWDLWQGPAPRRDYLDNIVHYKWHWRWHWGTGETCNNALHEVDVARWFMKLGHPEAVRAEGARRFYTDDDWEMYDTLMLRLSYPGGKRVVWDGHSCNRVLKFNRGRGTVVYGTKGSILIDRDGYEIFDLEGKSIRKAQMEASTDGTNIVGESVLDDLHVANFSGTIRGTAEQHAPIPGGHASTLACHLGNIAYRVGREIACDPETGRIKDDAKAAHLWDRDYERGWEVRI